jgi:hypothetical protein
MSSCRLCTRTVAEEGLCQYHLQAARNLRRSLDQWREAYGELSVDQYLTRVLELSEAGVWVREVAEVELQARREGQTAWE